MVFPDARIHFRSLLRVVATDEFQQSVGSDRHALWRNLNELIGQGVAAECGATDSFHRSDWFATGGAWGSKERPGVHVEVETNVGRFGEDAPEEWAVRAVFPFGVEDYRKWRTEVYVRRPTAEEVDGGQWLELQYRASWSIAGGYVGEEPTPPEDAAPELLAELTNDDQWHTMAGPVRLTPRPVRVNQGEALPVANLISDPERTCPLICIAYSPSTARPFLDPDRLATALAGAAHVIELRPGAEDELRALLPNGYACDLDTARVYMPSPFDGIGRVNQHRFINARTLERFGIDEATAQIVRGCARRCPHLLEKGVRTVDDVHAAAARYHARPRAAETPQAERERVRKHYELLLADEKRKTAKARDDVALLRQELREVASRPATAGSTAVVTLPQSPAADRHLPTYEELFEAIASNGLGVRRLNDAVDLVERLFPHRIAFTEAARKSAEAAGFNTLNVTKSRATRMLWHLATTMYDLAFVETAPQLATPFMNRTGIEVSFKEGRQTNRLPSASGMRAIRFEGRDYDITPHLKSGNDPKTGLRIHFDFDHHSRPKRIIVGHCGDHLVTAGTQKIR